MTLVDSNIVIERLRQRNLKLNALFDSLALASCGLIRGEVLSGVRTPVERVRTLSVLNALPPFLISNADWDFIGELRAQMFSCGFSLSLADVAIGGVAILHDIELWSRDKAHGTMASVIPALRLFVEPP